MKNIIMKDRGFTLMEVLVALFIGSMVTIALISMWKASSIQTAQAQRQTLVRNDISIFLRSFYLDFSESDEILCPHFNTNEWGTECPEGVFIGVKNMGIYLSDSNNYMLRSLQSGKDNDVSKSYDDRLESGVMPPKYIVYYRKEETKGSKVIPSLYRCEIPINLTDINSALNIDTEISKIINKSDLSSNDSCSLVLPYVEKFEMEQKSVAYGEFDIAKADYFVNIKVVREFEGKVPPIYIDFQRYFTKMGGA